MLEEMDEEFGVSDIVERETKRKTNSAKSRYSSEDLAGLTVEHSKQAFVEGKATVLVLKDKGVLEEDEKEILVNPSLLESEQWKKNAEFRKKKPGYNPYEEEFDEFGEPKLPTILKKYDEEIEGKKSDGFKLDETGSTDASREKELADIKARIRAANQTSLHQEPLQLATEYFTAEEMAAKFKKPKTKIKKIRKRGTLKADDLMPIAQDQDFGSRERGRGRKKEIYEQDDDDDDIIMKDNGQDTSRTKSIVKKEELEDFKVNMKELIGFDADGEEGEEEDDEEEDDMTLFTVEDDAEDELHAVLDKARKLRQLKDTVKNEDGTGVSEAEKVGKFLQKVPGGTGAVKEEPMDTVEDSTSSVQHPGTIVLDATSEYCRGLGEIPTYGLAGNREDAVDPDQFFDKEFEQKQRREQRRLEKEAKKKRKRQRHKVVPKDEYQRLLKQHRESRGQWVETEFHTSQTQPATSTTAEGKNEDNRPQSESSDSEDSGSESDEGPVLGKEHDSGTGVGGALKLAMQKGYIEGETDKKPTGVSLKHLEAQRYTIMDKQFHDIDDKYAKKLERMGAGSGPIRPFDEKDAYQPTIKITYTDELGRHMDEKDAFRFQSWKFHGKMPGKRKVEKRARKMLEKELMSHMTSSDTPLGTLGKQLDKQKALQLPYIVLSGSGSREVGTSIKKDTT